jgi:hypothetical protein
MSLGIKETKEIIAGMGEAAVTLKKLKSIFDDAKEGGIGAEDIVHLSKLIAAAPDVAKLTAAVDGADKALDELKDLEKAEVLEIIADLYKEADRLNKA